MKKVTNIDGYECKQKFWEIYLWEDDEQVGYFTRWGKLNSRGQVSKYVVCKSRYYRLVEVRSKVKEKINKGYGRVWYTNGGIEGFLKLNGIEIGGGPKPILRKNSKKPPKNPAITPRIRRLKL